MPGSTRGRHTACARRCDNLGTHACTACPVALQTHLQSGKRGAEETAGVQQRSYRGKIAGQYQMYQMQVDCSPLPKLRQRQAPTGCSRRAGKELSSRRSAKVAELAPPPAAAGGGGGGGGGGGSRGKKGEKFRALKAKEAAKKAARQAAPAAGPGPAQAQAQAQPRASEVAVAEKLKARARPRLTAPALQILHRR